MTSSNIFRLMTLAVMFHTTTITVVAANDIFQIPFSISLSRLSVNPKAATDVTDESTNVILTTSQMPIIVSTTTNSLTVTSAVTQPTTTSRPMAVTTTKSIQPDINNIVSDLQPMLSTEFSASDGYINLLTDQTSYSYKDGMANLSYFVFYNKTILFKKGMLIPNSAFVSQLRQVSQNISSYPVTITFGGFAVDGTQTLSLMLQTVEMVNAKFGDNVWVCSGITCSPNETCFQNSSNAPPICVARCQLFLVNNSCATEPSVAGVYVQGHCNYNTFGEPYCNCGTSVGGVLNNFYDGNQCVSSTFIVAMAASAGGFLLLLLLVAVCALCAKQQALKKAKKANKYKKEKRTGKTGSTNCAFEPNVASSSDGDRYTPSRQMELSLVKSSHPAPDYDAIVDADGMCSIRM